MRRVGQSLIYVYIRCVYGILGREITKYTVIYSVYIRFWPTLVMRSPHIQSQNINSCSHIEKYELNYIATKARAHRDAP
jgi:hypothetical protein